MNRFIGHAIVAATVSADTSNSNLTATCPGSCIDTSNAHCSTSTLTGLCSGGSNIRCCPAQCSGVAGTCIDTSSQGCSRSTLTGRCPGSSHIKCCPSGGGGGGTCRLYSGTAGSHEEYLLNAAKSSGKSGTELAQFMAQCAHECDSFNTMTEYASGKEYEGRTDLGNTHPGDGVRYKGRGYIQITGRSNYRTYGGYIGEDLENNPTLAEQPAIAAKVANEYWKHIVKPRVSNFEDTRAVTKLINGGTNGLSDRESKFSQYKSVCGALEEGDVQV